MCGADLATVSASSHRCFSKQIRSTLVRDVWRAEERPLKILIDHIIIRRRRRRSRRTELAGERGEGREGGGESGEEGAEGAGTGQGGGRAEGKGVEEKEDQEVKEEETGRRRRRRRRREGEARAFALKSLTEFSFQNCTSRHMLAQYPLLCRLQQCVESPTAFFLIFWKLVEYGRADCELV